MKQDKRQLLYTGGYWYEYADGAWNTWTTAEREAFNTRLYNIASAREFSFSTQRSAIWTTLSAALGTEKVIEFDAKPMLVARNGTYFPLEDKCVKHSPGHYATRVVDAEFDPDAECPLWLDALDLMFEDKPADVRRETIQCLQEWMGTAIVGGGNRHIRKGLFAYGESGTGKSSVADVLIELLGGKSRIAAPSLSTIGTRFGVEPLIGKAALITNEAANAKTQTDANALKALVTGEPIQVDRKNDQPLTFVWSGPIMFTTNELPRISNENTSALYDRFLIIEFTRVFTDEDAQETMGGHARFIDYMKAENQLSGILNWCVEGWMRATERGKLFIPSSSSTAGDRFRRQNDKVYDFVKTCCEVKKGSACGTMAVSIAAIEYALAYHGSTMPMSVANNAVARTIRSVLPSVRHEQGYKDKAQFRAYHNLALNADGEAMLRAAETKPYPALKAHLQRVNYRFG